MYTILDNIFTTYTIQLNSMRLQKEAPKEKPPFAEKYGWVWNDDNHHWMSSDTQEKVTESLPKEHQAEIGNEYIIGSKARNKKFRGAHAKITEFAEEGRRAKVQIGEESGWMNVDYLEQMINNGGLEQPKDNNTFTNSDKDDKIESKPKEKKEETPKKEENMTKEEQINKIDQQFYGGSKWKKQNPETFMINIDGNTVILKKKTTKVDTTVKTKTGIKPKKYSYDTVDMIVKDPEGKQLAFTSIMPNTGKMNWNDAKEWAHKNYKEKIFFEEKKEETSKKDEKDMGQEEVIKEIADELVESGDPEKFKEAVTSILGGKKPPKSQSAFDQLLQDTGFGSGPKKKKAKKSSTGITAPTHTEGKKLFDAYMQVMHDAKAAKNKYLFDDVKKEIKYVSDYPNWAGKEFEPSDSDWSTLKIMQDMLKGK